MGAVCQALDAVVRFEERMKVGLEVEGEAGEVEMQVPCLGQEHGGHLQ